MFGRKNFRTIIVVARGCGPRASALDADRRSGAMGRRRNAGLRPVAFARASETIHAGDKNGRRGPCSADIARSSLGRAVTLCRDGGGTTTVYAHTVPVDHASPRPTRIADRSGDALDNGDRVRRLAALAAGDRAVSLVRPAGGTIDVDVPPRTRTRRCRSRHPGSPVRTEPMIDRPFIQKEIEKNIALPNVPGSVQRSTSDPNGGGRHDVSQSSDR